MLATELFTLSGRVAAAGLVAEAVSPIRTSTDLLRGTASTAVAPVGMRSLFAALLQTLALRLLGAGRPDEVPSVVHETIAAYRHAAEAPGANLEVLATELFTLSRGLAGSGLVAEAVSPIRTSTDLLRGTASTAVAPSGRARCSRSCFTRRPRGSSPLAATAMPSSPRRKRSCSIAGWLRRIPRRSNGR